MSHLLQRLIADLFYGASGPNWGISWFSVSDLGLKWNSRTDVIVQFTLHFLFSILDIQRLYAPRLLIDKAS